MAGYLGVDVVKDGKYYFISYNTEDMDRVGEYVKALAGKGLPIWYDYGIEVGSKWEGTIAKRIHDSEAVVIFLSRNIFMKEQSFVHKEFEMARDFYDKKIYVVLLDDIKNQEVPERYVSWWIDIKHLQCIPAPNYSVEECADKLMAALGLAPIAAPAPQVKKNTGNRKWNPSQILIDREATEETEDPREPLELRLPDGGEAAQLAYAVEDFFLSRDITVKVTEIKEAASYFRYTLEFKYSNSALKNILKCKDDLNLELGRFGVRIYSGKNKTVCVEVPKTRRRTVYLADILKSPQLHEAQPEQLLFGLGENGDGQYVILDLCKMPHLLIGGSNSSEDIRVQLHTILLSIMTNHTPEQVKFLLISSQQEQFAAYKDLPYVLYDYVVKTADAAITAIKWISHEIPRRLEKLKEEGVRNLDDYNAKVPEKRKLHKIVICVGEMADLMQFDKDGFEEAVMRVAQMGRAAGVHLILAAGKLENTAVTGLIKANIPSRVAFATANGTDSRKILDETGAEYLMGNGDLLYQTIGMMKVERCQGAYVTDEEISSIVKNIAGKYQN